MDGALDPGGSWESACHDDRNLSGCLVIARGVGCALQKPFFHKVSSAKEEFVSVARILNEPRGLAHSPR